MTSAILVALLALAVGAGHNLLLRLLTDRLARVTVTALPMVAAIASVRFLVVLAMLGTLVSWGAVPALGALAGYWIGRTLVVVLSFRRRTA